MPHILTQYSVKYRGVQGVLEKRGRETRSQSSRSGAADAQPTVSRSRPRGALARRFAPRSRLPGRDARRQLRRSARPAGRRGVFEKKTRRPPNDAGHNPENGEHPMELMIVDPRAMKEDADQSRRSKSAPQAEA